jgi:hypothetical protein
MGNSAASRAVRAVAVRVVGYGPRAVGLSGYSGYQAVRPQASGVGRWRRRESETHEKSERRAVAESF